MPTELNLLFSTPEKVTVSLRGEYDDDQTDNLSFKNPLKEADLEQIRWYIETYGAHWTAEEDDKTAQEIERKLELWGAALYDAVFKGSDKAMYLAMRFRENREKNRILTVSSGDPLILSLPWELLKPPGGVFLCNENPRISIRRKHGKTGEGRTPLRREVKPALHVLFVVSRPADASFINPYADAKAVLDSLGAASPVTVEFLRPPTLKALGERLRDQDQPAVDVLHFDGHGVFDAHGGLKERADRSLPDYVQGLLREAEQRGDALTAPDKQGYLLFENENGEKHLVSAYEIGTLLYQQSIGLVVLSACQSAKMGEEAMGSVSAWLVHAGIGSVIAMTHSVLVTTTQKLFGAFYQALTKGKPVGAALDDARSALYFDPVRGERLRNNEPVTLKLYDWFLPALYQSGRDGALISSGLQAPPGDPHAPAPPGLSGRAGGAGVQAEPGHQNLPALQESGFYGRTRELWQIERAFGVQGTQRFSISGFGGQGKTYLATEAARWLLRAGLFNRAVFVSYASFQGEDAVGFAVSTLGAVLEKSLLDSDAAFTELKNTPTLVILDNLESLVEARTASPSRTGSPLSALLDTAAHWSENSPNIRILLTSRLPDLQHPKYPTSGSFKHQHLQLTGLAPQDALDWFNQLLRLPPGRERGLPPLKRVGLLEVLAKVAFHPLSIGLLAKVLQSKSLADVSPRLSALLAQESGDNAGLLASLNLSLDRLEAKARAWLPNLGVFQGGAMESQILKVTGVGKVDEKPEIAQARQLLAAMESGDMLAIARAVGIPLPENVELPPEIMQQLQALLPSILADKEQVAAEVNKHPQSELAPGADESTWATLKQSLLHTGLIQAENLTGFGNLSGLGDYLRFHPTLAPALAKKLTPPQAESLRDRHRQAYYQLSGELYRLDSKNPHAARAVARRELPNLLAAVDAALDAQDADAVDFAKNVNLFLNVFGLRREHERLAARAVQAGGARGSQAWYLARSGLGEQLYNAGRAAQAQAVFADLLDGLGDAPSYNRCLTLGRLGRCLAAQGQLGAAAARYRQRLEESAQLEQSQDVKRNMGIAHAALGDVLTDLGDYPGARAAYQAALAICTEQGGARQMGVVNGNLGTLALQQGQLAEAAQRYQAALGIFRQLNEPGSEAVIHHMLGVIYQRAQQWDAAEQAYREAARLKESQGMFGGGNGVAGTWNQLARVTASAGKPAEAEGWYRKAIQGLHATGDSASESKVLSNLAGLLLDLNQKERLAEARQLAEQALAIMETLDPVGAEIWKTYGLLGAIAEREGEPEKAAAWRAKRKAVIDSLPGEIRRNLGLG